jgi:hypothetical protein
VNAAEPSTVASVSPMVVAMRACLIFMGLPSSVEDVVGVAATETRFRPTLQASVLTGAPQKLPLQEVCSDVLVV